MAIQGIVALLVLIAGSSVISADTDTNTTVPVSTLDDSTNDPNVSSTSVNPSTILSTPTEMDAPNSTTSQSTTQVTSINPESTTTTEGTTIIPSSSTTTAPPHTRHFDGLSFLGGILLTVGAAGLLMGCYKYFGPGRGDKGAYNRIGMKDLYGESDHLQV